MRQGQVSADRKLGGIKALFSASALGTVSSICGIISFILQLFSMPSSTTGANIIAVILGIIGLVISLLSIKFLIELKRYGEKGRYYIQGKNVYINMQNNITLLQETGQKRVHTNIRVVIMAVFLIMFIYLIFSVGTICTYLANNEDNMLKAKMGNVYSQVYVADYYYEAGKEDESLYWYRKASESDNKFGDIACNNLAFLYWQKHKAEGDLELYLPQIYGLIKKAALNGNRTGVENLYSFVYYFDLDEYEFNEKDKKRIWDILIEDGFINDPTNFRQEVWEDAGIIVSANRIMFSDEYTKYTLRDISRALDKDDNTKIITTRVCTVEESNLKPDKMTLKYDTSISK